MNYSMLYAFCQEIIITMVVNMDNNFNIGERLFELRTNLGLSQEQLALRADITTTYLGQIEHNTKKPTVYVIEKLCSALNMTLKDFFDTEKYIYKHDMLTEQILVQIQKYSVEEKEFILAICKQLKILYEHSSEKKSQDEN